MTLVNPNRLPSSDTLLRMLALHARSLVLHDSCAYTTSASLWSLENSLSASVDSDTPDPEALARLGRYLHVGLLALPALQNIA
jgi:hypothetical protein